MDSREGPSTPTRPRQSVSPAAATLDRRRAFLQNFTPAFNIGPQASRTRPSAIAAAASRLSPIASPNPTHAQNVAKGTSMGLSSYLARRTRILPGGQMLIYSQETEPMYGDQLGDEEIGESEPEFEEDEINDDDVGHVELDGVDIDEVEEIQAEELEDMEAVDEEEEMDMSIQRFDTRFASQDEYDMYEDEELEEDYPDDELASSSFDQGNLADLARASTSSSAMNSRPRQDTPRQAMNISRAGEIGKHRMREELPEDWMSDEELEDLDEAEEADEAPPVVRRNQPQLPLKQGSHEITITPQMPIKVKPIISPDICDGAGARSAVRQQGMEILDEEDTSEDSDVMEVEPDITPTSSKSSSQQSSVTAGFPGRIRISFTHDSSPEKRPRRVLTPTQEGSNEDSNDSENVADPLDSPKKSRVSRESIPKRGVGRPKKPEKYQGDDSLNLESAEDSKDALETSRTSTADGARRTARTRKPTKQFVINFGGRSQSPKTPRKGQDKGYDESTDKDKSLMMTFRNVGDGVARGRGSSGRTRGRPKGSTAKLRTHATTCMENIVQEVMNKSGESEPTSDTEVTETDSPVKGPKKSSRGGRRERKPKVPKERNKRVAKSKPVNILDENAMMGYAKARDEFDNSVDGESLNLGDDDTRFSSSNNVNSPANSNLDSSGLKTKKQKNTGSFLAERKPVTAETLFDYWWTRDGKSERFILQEQISEFLGITSFKRKYPDLKRRTVDMEEREFLQREKIVTEVQCDLGLTPLYFDDVISILRQDFHSKYLELEEVWTQRLHLELERKKNEARPVERSPLKMKPEDVRKTLLRSTAEWNAAMNKDRQIHRSRAMDLQTFTIHEQIGRTQKFILPPEKTKVGFFPTPVLIGHYVDLDRVPKWTPEELKYLPLNTPVYGPLVENTVGDSEDSESDSEDSSTTDDTSSSSDLTGKQEPSSDTDDNANGADNITPLVVGDDNNLGGPEAMSVICKSCNGGIMNNKDAVPEMIIHCTKCKVPNHPSCLELSLDMLPFILKYNWQCTDCKNCIECNDPADEDKMLFCDLCDRGYHIYCVGLRKVPTGRWHCRVCAMCYSCGAKTPSEEDRLAEWHHEFKKGEKNSKFYLHSQCVNCHKLFKKGQHCPCCLKVHLKFDRSDKSLIECRTCEKWVHAECAKSKPISSGSGTMFGFRCDACEAAFKIRTKIRTPFGSCP